MTWHDQVKRTNFHIFFLLLWQFELWVEFLLNTSVSFVFTDETEWLRSRSTSVEAVVNAAM